MTEDKRYDILTQSLHWGMALLIIAAWVIAGIMEDMPRGPEKAQVVGLHKSLGVTVCVLLLARIFWRRVKPPLAMPAGTPAWMHSAATAGHLALYALMLAVPVSGVVMSQAADRPVLVWGLFALPTLIAPNPELKSAMEEVHEVLGNGILLLAAAHAVAALFHQHVLKDGVLTRMLPRMPSPAEKSSRTP